MARKRRRLPVLLLAASLALPALATAGDPQRGRGLYEQRCGGCHTESVHGRAHRVARDAQDVRRWVRHWSERLGLGWGEEEVEDVTAYLDAPYYGFPCDAPPCRALSMTRPSPRR